MINIKSKKYVINFTPPDVRAFLSLRQKIGWGEMNLEMAQQSLSNSLFHVQICHDFELIAMGRIVGDGYMYFYVQDIIVDPYYQGLGLGKVIMQYIETYLSKEAGKGATIGLLAAKDKEGFYKSFGYIERSGKPLGRGMCKFI
ncbi:GNAT family N-acetyltransferase [Pseudoalteromonas denitrificans]|uniref:Acetyltransferase (GNAT) domain-containing protein n=1 Tax=Pseudoalteromonas denitrificans DSM 6059 TaxID=1123010 RepID=A0A1I1DY09_9GAMM|nr:GNAT family N-acetyltransferase [Pseudoalteromonas denitrificans]SFB79825.1 Acetyltransferase (GNAT) domain-containing protein [Pseudoalteromonas denitrificans DSM 6059]